MLRVLPSYGADHDRLRTALDSLPLAVFAKDRNSHIVLMNSSCERLWGAPESELRGTTASSLFPPERHARSLEVDRRILAEGVDLEEEDWLRDRDSGEERLIRTIKRPLRDDQGVIAGIVGVAYDITDQHRAEHARKASEVRLASVVESALDGILTCDERGRVMIFNGAAEIMFGIRREQILGRPLEQLIPLPFRASHGGWMRDFGESTTLHRRMRGPGHVYALRANGEQFPVEASISHARVDGESLYTVVLRDITERVSQQAALQASEQAVQNLNRRLELAVKGSGFGVWEFDLTAGRLIWDTQMYRVYGHTPETFDGSPDAWKCCVHEDDRAMVDKRFEDLLAGIPVPLFLFRIQRHSDGALRFIEANGYMQPDAQGRPQRLVGMNRDATERVLADEALRQLNSELEERVAERTRQLSEAKDEADAASRAKSAFLANMSHELRTPLHSILGFVKLAIEDHATLTATQRQRFLERIRNAGSVLLDLVNDLLDSAKIEARRLELSRVPIDLAQVLHNVLDEQQVAIEEKSLVLTGRRLARAPMHGDPARIAQALRNVLANAIRFSPPRATLSVELGVVLGAWRVTIEDEGPGIPADELERVFESFTQSSLTSTGSGGTGLGLPITRGIVELHGGRVWAERRAGGIGARFVLDLPGPTRADEFEGRDG